MERLLEDRRPLKVGVFVDLRKVRPNVTFASHTARTIELLVESERLGADAAWFTEHHGFSDGYLPQPLILAAAVAARTTTMRVGTAIVLAPVRHPRHLAEEAALVDILSDGRLELGLGAGYAPQDYDAFDAPMDRRYDRTDHTAREVQRMLLDGTVQPQPVQAPVPMWLGYQGPSGAARAGRLGLGLLSLNRALLGPYLTGVEQSGLDASTARMGGVIDVVVADDPEQAAQRVLPHWLHQQNTYRAAMNDRSGARTTPLDEGRARDTLARTGRLGTLRVLDVEGAIALVTSAVEGLPVDHVYAWLSVGDMPGDLVERHLELWSGPVRQALQSTE